MDKRVVVTGMGVISPVGNNVANFWKNLLDGVCGIDFIKAFPTDDLPVKIAGEVKDRTCIRQKTGQIHRICGGCRQ